MGLSGNGAEVCPLFDENKVRWTIVEIKCLTLFFFHTEIGKKNG
jgi:hypothetical protein